uniref:Uncharacterized protein n=1 Tax=Glossina pallidipes TaxID=7398 RepID=A0A1A9ZIH9_GLOPL
MSCLLPAHPIVSNFFLPTTEGKNADKQLKLTSYSGLYDNQNITLLRYCIKKNQRLRLHRFEYYMLLNNNSLCRLASAAVVYGVFAASAMLIVIDIKYIKIKFISHIHT